MNIKEKNIEQMYEGIKRIFGGFFVFSFCLALYFGFSAILSHFFYESDSFAVKENAVPGIRLTTKKKEELKRIEEQGILTSKVEKYDVSAMQIRAYSAYEDPFQNIVEYIQIKNDEHKRVLQDIKRIHHGLRDFLFQELPKKHVIYAESGEHFDNANRGYPFVAFQLVHEESPLYLYYLGAEKNRFFYKLKNYIKKNKLPCQIYDEGSFFYVMYKNRITHVIRLRELEERMGTISLLNIDKFYMTIILDDAGENLPLAKECMDLPFPVILSIWPKSTHAVTIAVLAHEKGLPVFLHQPMEAYPHEGKNMDIGGGGLYINMSYKQMHDILSENIKKIPYVQGINNHMGSKFTEDAKAVEKFLRATREIKPILVLLDSVTGNNSKLYKIGKEHNFLITKRDFFIDNSSDKTKIMKELNKAYTYAQQYKKVILIGHVRKSTVEVLKNWRNYRNDDLSFSLPAVF